MNRPAQKKPLCYKNKIGFEIAEIWLVRVVPGSGGALGYPHACFVPCPYSPAMGGAQSLYHCSEPLKHMKCEILKDYLMFGFLE